jgi:hypothetical protein
MDPPYSLIWALRNTKQILPYPPKMAEMDEEKTSMQTDLHRQLDHANNQLGETVKMYNGVSFFRVAESAPT